jgi:hypothetical protein
MSNNQEIRKLRRLNSIRFRYFTRTGITWDKRDISEQMLKSCLLKHRYDEQEVLTVEVLALLRKADYYPCGYCGGLHITNHNTLTLTGKWLRSVITHRQVKPRIVDGPISRFATREAWVEYFTNTLAKFNIGDISESDFRLRLKYLGFNSDGIEREIMFVKQERKPND